MDEVDSNVNQTKRGGSKEWLNKKVGNAPRNSRHVFCRDDEDEDCHSSEISNKYHERNSVRSLKSNSSNDDQDRERRRSVSDDEDDAVMMGGRKKSFEVMSEAFADLELEESIGFNKHSNTNSSEAHSCPRRRSFCDDEEEAEEIQDLVRMGVMTSSEGERRIESMKISRAAHIPTYSQTPTGQRNGDESQRFHSDFLLVPLFPGDKDYDDISDEMYSAGLDVIKVERLKNQMSFDRFESEKEIIARGRKTGYNLNVRYLYHGTSVKKETICEEGLDQRLSRLGYFGKGIYFSDNPLKCVNYAASSDTHGQSYLLKCKVLLGDQKCYKDKEYDTSLKREPEKENPVPGEPKFYDSVMGCPKDYYEYVVYENRRALIEYIITFKVNQQGSTKLRERVPSPVFTNQMKASSPAFTDQTKENMAVKNVNTDDHFEKISQVREAIRKKRCAERGQQYEEPDPEKKKQDKEMWLRLQKLHGVDASTLPSLEEKTAQLRHAASQPQFGCENLEDSFTESTQNTTVLPHSQSFTYGEPDDVEQVMSSLISEFMGVTDCDNVETARHYITKTDMNIDQAIVSYYDDMP